MQSTEDSVKKRVDSVNEVKRRNIVFSILGSVLFLAALAVLRRGSLAPAGKEEVITIGIFSDSYWEVQNGYSYQILEDAITLFEKENPGVKVEYVSGILKSDYPEWLSEQIILGKAPDVFLVFGDNFSDLAEIGALKSLDALVEEDREFSSEVFYASALACGKYQEEQYALPYECAPRLMFVNKTILDAEGIAVPEKDWTWDEFYEICKAVTKDMDGNGTADQFGVTDYTWSEAFDSNGVQLFNESGSECYLADERVKEAILFMERLEGLCEGYQVTNRDFDLGKVAFRPMLFSEYRAYKSYPLSIKKYSSFDWECISMPAGESGSNRSQLDTLMIAMNENTAHKQTAWKFMKLLAADERMQEEIFDYSEGVSVLKAVTESEKTRQLLIEDSGKNSRFNLSILSDAVENAVVTYRFRNYEEALIEVDKAVRDIMEGNANISMQQTIWNREINRLLKNKMEE